MGLHGATPVQLLFFALLLLINLGLVGGAGGFSAFLRTSTLRIRQLPASLLPLYHRCFFPYGLVKEDAREKGLSR